MIAWKNNMATPVALEAVAGNRKFVPLDHCWVESAKRVGTNLGI
jgi:6-phosphofructokinase 1